jgi:hypothetical protein
LSAHLRTRYHRSMPSEQSPARASRPRASALREHRWSTGQRVALIAVLAIVMGSLFVTTYSLALGDPVPHRIDAAVVGDPAAHVRTVAAAERVADDSLVFQAYGSVAAARRAIDLQQVYAALDLVSGRPTLYVASAAGASVARLLEHAAEADPRVRVVDTHPLGAHDPSGVDIFYLMLVATVVGFLTIFQVLANGGPLSPRGWALLVVTVALGGSLAFTLVDGPLLHRLDLPIAETWGILALQLTAVGSFTRLMTVLIGRWAILPTWLFFVVLGNSASGGAVAPPLLPRPFAFVSQWLPSGATVTALRNAIYFRPYQHVHPIAVLAIWAAALFAAMLVVSRWRRAQGGSVAPTATTGSRVRRAASAAHQAPFVAPVSPERSGT